MAIPANYNPYDAMRRRTQQSVTAQNQTAQDALRRRFASLGQGQANSGRAIRAGMMQEKQGQESLQNAMSDIDIQEANEMQRRREVLEGRQYGTSEREGAQNFQAAQAALQRAYGTQERLGGQAFQQKQLDFQNQMAQREFDAQTAQNALTNTFNIQNLAASLDLDLSDPSARWKLQQYLNQAGQYIPR